MKNLIEKYTKLIAKQEGFEIKVYFKSFKPIGKKNLFGLCTKWQMLVGFNNILLLPDEALKKINPRVDRWEVILHEICHLKNDRFLIEKTNEELLEGEVIDRDHNLSFWKEMRQLRKKYSDLEKEFRKELKNL